MTARKLRKSWWCDFYYQGKRIRERSPLNTRGGANEYEATLRGRLVRGEPLTGREESALCPIFKEFAARWFETYVRANCKPSGVYTKETLLRRHLVPWFGAKHLTDITSEDVEAYKRAMTLAHFHPKSINDHLAVLGRCLNSAVEWKVVLSRPMIKLMRVPPSGFDVLTPKETAALLADNVEPKWNAMLHVAARTGMRPCELTSLTWDDVNFEGRIISVRTAQWRGVVGSPKNNRMRNIPMTDDTWKLLKSLPRQGELVFCRDDGTFLTDIQRKAALIRICRRVGMRIINWYTLRHTFASTLVANGAPLPVVQQLMGHSTITMTMRYTHVAPLALREAIATLAPKTPKSGQPAVNRTLEDGTQQAA